VRKCIEASKPEKMLFVGSSHDIYQSLDYDFDPMRQNDFVENLYQQKATYIRQTADIHCAIQQ
jgi:hypothetical protein